jgi:hypothetical protein
MMPARPLFLATMALCFVACASPPTGPNVMVLPGGDKTLDRFQAEDAQCRQWASRQIGTSPAEGANKSTATGATIGTAVGAAGGAAIGAAAGSPATGAAVGSGVGLLGGTATGAGIGEREEWTLQQRYDVAYMQCMYINGNQIPVPRGSAPMRSGRAPSTRVPAAVPPPPAGVPPPPPPGAS